MALFQRKTCYCSVFSWGDSQYFSHWRDMSGKTDFLNLSSSLQITYFYKQQHIIFFTTWKPFEISYWRYPGCSLRLMLNQKSLFPEFQEYVTSHISYQPNLVLQFKFKANVECIFLDSHFHIKRKLLGSTGSFHFGVVWTPPQYLPHLMLYFNFKAT